MALDKQRKIKREMEYQKTNMKRIPFSIQLSEYEALKEQADSVPMNTFIKKALNAYTGQEIFNV